jgi:hypothetical protein
MPSAQDYGPLAQALERLRSLGVVPRLGRRLEAERDAVHAGLAEAILSRIPAFTESRNPDLLPELAAHSARHVEEIARLLAGGAPGDFAFVVDNARRRAEQRFPLEASLHAYRCGLRAMSTWIRDHAEAEPGVEERDLAAAVADFSIEYTDLISSLLTAEYVAHTRRLSEAEGDRRTELLNILLGGYDESDGRVARLLRRAGYLEQRQSYCVALAQPVEAREMDNPARARRLADAMTELLSRLPGRRLVGLRERSVVAIVSDTRRLSGWTAPQTKLADRVYAELLNLGTAAIVGMSADVPSTAHIPRYSDIPVRRMLVRHAREGMGSALPAWTDALIAADTRSGGALIATLDAYANADMNVLRAAQTLGVHSNTVYGRLQKIADLTGHDARHFHSLTELLLATACRL